MQLMKFKIEIYWLYITIIYYNHILQSYITFMNDQNCKRSCVVLDCFKNIALGNECKHIKDKTDEFKQKLHNQYLNFIGPHDLLDCAYEKICCDACIEKIDKLKHLILYYSKHHAYLREQYTKVVATFISRSLADKDNNEALDIRPDIKLSFQVARNELYRELSYTEKYINNLLSDFNRHLDRLYEYDPYAYLV